jgi:VanZ family protein
MRFRYLAAAIFWVLAVLIGFLSLQSADSMPDIQVWDKIQHLIAYCMLAAAGLIAYPARVWRVVIGCLIYGIFIEIAQGWILGRFASIEDGLANSIGIGLAFGIFCLRSVRDR